MFQRFGCRLRSVIALGLISLAASSPSHASFISECHAALEMADTPRAVKPCTQAGLDGDLKAQLFLGKGYKTPYRGFAKDIREALRWFEAAASQGSGEAFAQMSMIYMDGDGVLQNYRKGREYAEQAAIRGETTSQYELARIYTEGIGVQENPRLAYVFSTLCVFTSGGDGVWAYGCKDMRDEAERKMSPSQVQAAQDAAAKVVEISGMQGP